MADREKKLKEMEERRKKLQQLKDRRNQTTRQGENPSQETRPQGSRNWNLYRQTVSLSIQPRAATPPQTYEMSIQCELTSKSMDAKTSKQQEQDPNLDLLQPRQKKRKQDRHPVELVVQPIKSFFRINSALTEDEISSVIKSKHFSDFINQTTKMCEKVLEHGDGQMLQLMLQDDMKANQHGRRQILSPSVKFYDQHYSQNRVVTAIDWSPQIPELLLASYSQNQQGNIKDHVGVLLLWSLNLRTRPEFHCFCQSMITAAKFFPYSNSTILGGCYNGQLLLWDLRTKSLPVQRTGLSSQGHKYPVYAMNIVGTHIANTVVSMSNDGKLCIWDIRSFSNPIRQAKQDKSDINVTCSQFPEGDVNTYYYGTQNSAIYKGSLHTTQSQSTDQKQIIYEGHNGPITGLSVNNPASEYSALSGLVLSSSFDWSVKLWSPKTNSLIRTFQHSDDYIYDVDWHPQNPALFSSSNNEGYLDIWDLTSDLQIPLVHTRVGKHALNKCMWNLDGTKIMTGDSQGTVNVFDLDKKHQRIDPSKTKDLQTLLLQSQDG